MFHRNPIELARTLAPRQRLLGLDVGSKTVGLALSDTTRRVATPHMTLHRTKFAKDADTLLALIAREGVGGLVIGLPLNMNGSEGPRCQSVRQFARNLGERIDVGMAFWDERLSTAAVERVLIEADTSRQRRKQVIDKLAAAYILQGAMDSLRGAIDSGALESEAR